MATHRLFIPAGLFKPDTSGSVWSEPYSIQATNDFWDHEVLIFDDTSTDLHAYGLFEVPANYVSAAKFYLVWTAIVTTGNVVLETAYRSVGGDDTTSLDQATSVETQTVTAGPPTAANRRRIPSITPTAGNFTAGDTVELRVSRNGTSGSDTMAGKVILMGVRFEYADV